MPVFLSKSCRLFRRKCRWFFRSKYWRFFWHKNTGQCLVCENLWKGRTSTTYKSEKCLEFSPGSWSIFLTRGKHRIYSKGTLVELELHTNQKDSFKKVVEFCDRSVDDFYGRNIVDFFGGNIVNFFGGNIVDFFDTKMDKWKNSYSVYSVSCPCVVKLISSTELHQNSKFWSESDSPVPLCDSTIYLACSALLDWAKPAGQDSFFKVFELVLLWCWLPCQLLVPVLVLLNPCYSVLPLDKLVNICEYFEQFRGSFAAILESCTSRPIISALRPPRTSNPSSTNSPHPKESPTSSLLWPDPQVKSFLHGKQY